MGNRNREVGDEGSSTRNKGKEDSLRKQKKKDKQKEENDKQKEEEEDDEQQEKEEDDEPTFIISTYLRKKPKWLAKYFKAYGIEDGMDYGEGLDLLLSA